MDTLRFSLLFGLVCVLGCHGVTAQCAADPAVPVASTRLSAPQTTYALDDPVVFSCDQDVGWGHIVVRCKEAGWGDYDRACEDQSNIEGGFIAGLMCSIVTLVVVVVFIVLSQRHGKKKDAEEACAAAAGASTSGATANGGSRRGSTAGGLKPVVANHRRGSVAHILD